MVSVAQCVVLTALYTSCSLFEWHPCWHHIISSPSLLVYKPAYICSHFTSAHDPPTSLRCWHGSGAVCVWRLSSSCHVTMEATDEDLQKLGKPPIYSGKDEWNEWSLVVKSFVSFLSAHVPALLTSAENPVASPDVSIATIRATLTEDGVTAVKKLLHVLNVTGPALAVIRGIKDMNGALAWRALITRYAPNTAPRVAKSHERNPLQCKDFSLRAHSIRDRTGRKAREHSKVGIDFRRPFQRVNKESSLCWRSTFIGACPTSDAEPGYIRGDDSSDSSVPATQRTVSGRCDSDTQQQERTRWHGDRCLDEERQRHKQGKEQNWWIKDELLRMRTCWPHGQRLLVQGHQQGQRTQQGQERQRQKAQAKGRTVWTKSQLRQSRRRLHQEGTPPVKSRESSKMTLGTLLSPWMRMKTMNTKLDTSWQRSDTEEHSHSPKIGRVYAFWWTIAKISMCVFLEISSGSPLSQARILIWCRQEDTN